MINFCIVAVGNVNNGQEIEKNYPRLTDDTMRNRNEDGKIFIKITLHYFL